MRWRIHIFAHSGIHVEELDGVAQVGWQEYVVSFLDTDNNVLFQFPAINVCKVEPVRMPLGFLDS